MPKDVYHIWFPMQYTTKYQPVLNH